MAPKSDKKEQWKKQFTKKKSFKKKPAKRIKGAIVDRDELKYAGLARASYTTASSITLVNGVAQGDDNTTREGRQVTFKSVHVTGFVYPSGAGGQSPQRARILLVWDNACNGAAPAITDIMTTSDPVSLPVVDNANRFTVLRDWHEGLAPISSVATQSYAGGTCVHDVDLFVPLDAVTQFIGTGATIASIQNGAIWLLVLIGGLYVADLQVRVRFTDD